MFLMDDSTCSDDFLRTGFGNFPKTQQSKNRKPMGGGRVAGEEVEGGRPEKKTTTCVKI